MVDSMGVVYWLDVFCKLIRSELATVAAPICERLDIHVPSPSFPRMVNQVEMRTRQAIHWRLAACELYFCNELYPRQGRCPCQRQVQVVPAVLCTCWEFVPKR